MIYDHEMDSIKSLWKPKSFSILQFKSLHTLQYFTFRDSTPDPRVSTFINKTFFDSASRFPIISLIGVFPACDVWDYDQSCASFIKTVPMLSLSLVTQSTATVDVLRKKDVLKSIELSDLIKELVAWPFEEHEMVSCLEWVTNGASKLMLTREVQSSFLAVARFSYGNPSRFINLSNIRTVLDVQSSFILPEAALPDHTLLFTMSKLLAVEVLTEFFAWTKLSVVQWRAWLQPAA